MPTFIDATGKSIEMDIPKPFPLYFKFAKVPKLSYALAEDVPPIKEIVFTLQTDGSYKADESCF